MDNKNTVEQEARAIQIERHSLDELSNRQPFLPPRTCKKPFCSDDAQFGRNYCARHGPGGIDSRPRQPLITGPTPTTRTLRRDIERVEAKLDALLMAHDVEFEEGSDG